MAEETAIFWGMGCGQRLLFARAMTTLAELFRLFFPHSHKSFMIRIMGKRPGGFRWSLQQKIEQRTTACKKQYVGKNMLVLGRHAVVGSEEEVR